MSDPNKNRRAHVQDEEAAWKAKYRSFCDAVMADVASVGEAEADADAGVPPLLWGVMRHVPNYYAASARNIVIRQSDCTFWTVILNELAQEKTSNRVAVVGSPGIGKSTTVAFAIRLLLQQGKTIVYKYRTEDESGYYVQLTPKISKGEEGNDVHVDIEVYPETTVSSHIPALLDPETYYLIDPGKTKTSCNPGPFVVCRVIIVASPDDRHWGGSGFMKDEDGVLGGEIRYFPPWTLSQLKAASTQLSNVQFQVGEVEELYDIFGGIPRHVFAPERKERNFEELKTKVESMQDSRLRDIVTGQINRHSGFGIDQPGGGVVAFQPSEDFHRVELKLASSSILEWIRARFMDFLWTSMALYPSPMSWQLLEDYVLHALQNNNQYCVRECVGKEDARYNQFQDLSLGGCTGTVLKSDCTDAVVGVPDLTVVFSSDKQHQLYDMIYKDGTIYHAFQITEGKSHKARQRQINSVAHRLQIGTNARELRLYYAVHDGVFDNFVTEPVKPVFSDGVSIYHLKLVQGLVA